MNENTPNDLIGMIGLVVHAKKAIEDVKEVTSIWTAAFLQVYESLKIGLSFSAFIQRAFYQQS